VGTSRYSGAAGSRRPAGFFPAMLRFNFPRAPVNLCAASPCKQVKFERFEVVDMLRITCANEKGARHLI